MIITNATLITLWEQQPFIEGALVAIDGKTIVDFGKMGKLIFQYEDAETLDAGGRVVMPGLINGHAHLCRSLAPGMPEEGETPRTFRNLQEKLWWRLERALGEEDIYSSALVGLLDSVREGVTTVFEHHSSPGVVSGSLDAIWKGFAEVGVRGCLSYGVSDRDGQAAASAGIRENQRFIERFQGGPSDMMAGLFGLDASMTLSEKTLAEATQTGKALGAGFHLHLAEDVSDVEDARSKYGKTPVERLAEAGVFTRGSLAAHCIHLGSSDYDLLQTTGTTAVQCPQSNMASAVGTVDLLRLSLAGIPLATGTNGFSPSVLEEFRAAVLQQRTMGRVLSKAMGLASRAVFAGNADLATSLYGPPVGRVKPGARADLVVLDYEPSTPLTKENFMAHLFSGLGRASPQAVLINGKVVLNDGEFTWLDERRIRARARAAAKKLWNRM